MLCSGAVIEHKKDSCSRTGTEIGLEAAIKKWKKDSCLWCMQIK
jgi:hypothetical protein